MYLHCLFGRFPGAHFLLKTAQRFHKLLMDDQRDDESKELDNLIILLAYLYLFKVSCFSTLGYIFTSFNTSLQGNLD